MKVLKSLTYLAMVIFGCLVALVALIFRPKLYDRFSPSQKLVYQRFSKNGNAR